MPARPGDQESVVERVPSVGAAVAEDSFAELYRREFPRLAGVLLAMCGVRAVAEEVAQDAFVHAWSRWPRVARSPSPAGWVYTTAFRMLRRRLKRRWPHLAPVSSPPDATEAVGGRLDVHRALILLPFRQQEVVALRYLLGLSTAEVAVRLGLSEGAVRALLHRGIIALRTTLDPSSPPSATSKSREEDE